MPYLPIASKQRQQRKRQPTGRQGVYNAAWANISRLYRIANPLCELCLLQGKTTDATPGGRKGVTDHIVRVAIGGAQRDERNLCALCKPCHDRKSALELRGWGTEAINTSEGLVPVDKEAALRTLMQQGEDGE